MKKILIYTTLLVSSLVSLGQTHTNYSLRYATNPEDVKSFTTDQLRNRFAIEKLFSPDSVNLVYSMHDRFIVGGIMPVKQQVQLETFEYLKAPNFLHRREIGIINVGGSGKVKVGSKIYELQPREALYIGSGDHEVYFSSNDANNPSHFYFNSATAHTSYPTKKITLEEAPFIKAGSATESNEREIHQLIVQKTCQTCQLQMGMTELKNGSVWNTMPAHTHTRRMEAYFYFAVPEPQAIAHFMGEPQESRVVWLHNEQAIIAPEWSIHAGAGTASYTFIWGMAGENLNYSDMDGVKPNEIK